MWRPLSFPSPDKLKIFSRIFFTPRLCKNISQLRSAKRISIFYTFSYSGCSAVELLISRKGWKGKIKKKETGRKILPCRLLRQGLFHQQRCRPSQWHTNEEVQNVSKIFNILNQRLKRDALHLGEPLCVLLGCVQGVDPHNNAVLLNVPAEDTCLQVDFATNSDQNIWKPSRLLEVMHHQDEEGWQVRRILRTPPKQFSAQGRLSSCRCTSPCVAENGWLLEGWISPVGEHVTVGYRIVGSLQCLSLTSLPHVSLAPGEVGFLFLDINSLEQKNRSEMMTEENEKEMTNDKYLTLTTSFPPRIAIWIAASITFRMLTFGPRPRWSSRTSEYVPLFNHLFFYEYVHCPITFSLCLKFFVLGAPPK